VGTVKLPDLGGAPISRAGGRLGITGAVKKRRKAWNSRSCAAIRELMVETFAAGLSR